MSNDYRCEAPSFLPSTAVLELTYKCNHQCLFCSCPWYAKGNGFRKKKELKLESWKKIIAKLCTLGICNIAFTGGEPLLKAGLAELINYAAECKADRLETKNGKLVKETAPPKLYLLSNAKAMNNNILSLCQKHGINLSMSLPGLTSFNIHTQRGAASNVLYWFGKANKLGVPTTAGITVTKKNIGELYQTISGALLAGADTLLLNRFLPGGRGIKYQNELSLSRTEIITMLDTAERVLALAGRFGSVGTELPKCIIKERKYRYLKVGTRCSAAIDFFVIGPSGHVRVCNHSPVRLNHIDELEELKNNPYWKKFAFKKYLPQECSGCKEMLDCDGGCREAAHIAGGSIDSADPLLS